MIDRVVVLTERITAALRVRFSTIDLSRSDPDDEGWEAVGRVAADAARRFYEGGLDAMGLVHQRTTSTPPELVALIGEHRARSARWIDGGGGYTWDCTCGVTDSGIPGPVRRLAHETAEREANEHVAEVAWAWFRGMP